MMMKVPDCKKHKTGKCMEIFYCGDGVNQPIESRFCCKYAIRELRKHQIWDDFCMRKGGKK